jgi:hypothetical protein
MKEGRRIAADRPKSAFELHAPEVFKLNPYTSAPVILLIKELERLPSGFAVSEI